MVSSLNHHISILKLTIHDAYLDYLATAKCPENPPKETDWSRPKLQRSEWLDLFDMEQRVLAFRALWAVMDYLSRDVLPVSNREANGSGEAGKDVQMAEG
jgi:hypothetical protein